MAVDASGLLRQLDELAREKTQQLAEGFAEEARSTAQRRTGAMAEGVKVFDVIASASKYTAEVVSEAEHGVYQEHGTGIYAGRGRIRPHNPQGALAFDWPAGGGAVFFKSVAGTPPTRWWSRAVANFPSVVSRVSQ